jgi:hypothetical protein
LYLSILHPEKILKRSVLIPAAAYILCAAIIFPYVQYYADNPDTFQYIEIAQKIIDGDWAQAVNGYWSPLIIWLLTIPLLLISDELAAFKILQLLIGVFALFQWRRLIQHIPVSEKWKEYLAFFIIPFLLDYSLLNLTPDLLFMALLILLLNLFLSGNVFSNRSVALKAAVTGGLLFLTKSFGFPFFIGVAVILLLLDPERLSVMFRRRNVVVLFSGFFFISILWILALSNHYDRFTISEAARFNMNKEVAPLPGRSAELPVLGDGLYEPPAGFTSAWISPGEYISEETITFFSSPAEYFQVVKRNLLSIYYFDFRNQAGALFFLLMLVLLFRKKLSEILREKWAATILIFIVLVYFGYSLVLVHSRYIWICTPLMVLLSVCFTERIFTSANRQHFVSFIVVVLLLLAVKRPVKEILFTADANYPNNWILMSLKSPLKTMSIFYRDDVSLNKVENDFKSDKPVNGNVASLKNDFKERDSYTNALRLVIKSDGKYFGQIDNAKSFQEQLDELHAFNIQYLITWNNSEWKSGELVYADSASGTRVYDLEKRMDK